MEKSNKKLANTLLYYVIGLSLAVIIAVTLMTAASKKDTPIAPVTDETLTEAPTSRSLTGTEKPASATSKSTEAESTVKQDKSSTEDESLEQETTKPVVSPQKETYSAPVNGFVSKEYTVDVPVYSVTMNDYRAHTGVDFVCEEGSAVSSCASGTVKSVYNHPMMGTTVVVEHADGLSSYYMNLNENLPSDIKPGSKVNKGQVIGAVGATAMVEVAQEPHLHFEMTAAGAYIDPMTVIDMSTVTVMSDQAFE